MIYLPKQLHILPKQFLILPKQLLILPNQLPGTYLTKAATYFTKAVTYFTKAVSYFIKAVNYFYQSTLWSKVSVLICSVLSSAHRGFCTEVAEDARKQICWRYTNRPILQENRWHCLKWVLAKQFPCDSLVKIWGYSWKTTGHLIGLSTVICVHV